MKLTSKVLKKMIRKELSSVLFESLYEPREFQKIDKMFDQGEESIEQALYFIMQIAGVTGDTQIFDDKYMKTYKIVLQGEGAERQNVEKLASALQPFADSRGFTITKNTGYPEYSVDMSKESDFEEDYDDGYPQGAPGSATGY